MEKRIAIVNQIRKQGLLPLFFHADLEVCTGVLRALYEAGLRTVEYTNRGPEALKNFEQLRGYCDLHHKDMWLGAGTIKDASAARDFINAGADFLVSPGLAEDVFDLSYSEKILWIPGCMSVSEIMQAEQFGLEMIKLFPGNLLGPSFVSAIKEIFPNLLFVPTGGVKLEKKNLEDWFRSGIVAVGMGSQVITKSFLEKNKYKKITTAAKEAMNLIKEIRKEEKK
jgi:2-dehydro-3-deoxyphosphogluconate aldolase/(4S)-4-hydroxy-2-oxoglutarate aldolase